MTTRCPTCDRTDCQADSATAEYCATAGDSAADIWARIRHAGALDICKSRRVAWRARCLAAEDERDQAIQAALSEGVRAADISDEIARLGRERDSYRAEYERMRHEREEFRCNASRALGRAIAAESESAIYANRAAGFRAAAIAASGQLGKLMHAAIAERDRLAAKVDALEQALAEAAAVKP